ncbi:MAG: glycosyltransferase [Nitrospiraceae bacterium]|nr:glycosyltransferase [Nitrospiraceae bacterium]
MMIDKYKGISPTADLDLLRILGARFSGRSLLNVNSTRSGGGVAELLGRIVPFLTDLGIDVRWETIEADNGFFGITKKIHNALQGGRERFTHAMWDHYEEVNGKNADALALDADVVFIHGPQPAPLIKAKKSGKWIWRCHIDMSSPSRTVARRILKYVKKYDASVFSVAQFAPPLARPEFVVLPSIDPLSEKNRELPASDISAIAGKFGIPMDRPVLVQVSRFDRFKDQLGVIKAYRLVKKYNDCCLVLAGSPASDDPEGEKVLNEVREFAGQDKDIKILLLPPGSGTEINAIQRLATIVLQKSLKEGFGLTVSEAMWKGKPVIGSAVGGITSQIIHGVNGFLVYSIEGAALRARQLLNNTRLISEMGRGAREHVRKNFLITRQIRDYLAIWAALENRGASEIQLAL